MTGAMEREIVVAKDGSGDFSSLQAAVDSIPDTENGTVRILLRKGEYREKAVIHRDRIRLTGEDREGTVLAWNGCAKDRYENGEEKGTFLSSTLMSSRSERRWSSTTGLTIRLWRALSAFLP